MKYIFKILEKMILKYSIFAALTLLSVAKQNVFAKSVSFVMVIQLGYHEAIRKDCKICAKCQVNTAQQVSRHNMTKCNRSPMMKILEY